MYKPGDLVITNIVLFTSDLDDDDEWLYTAYSHILQHKRMISPKTPCIVVSYDCSDDKTMYVLLDGEIKRTYCAFVELINSVYRCENA